MRKLVEGLLRNKWIVISAFVAIAFFAVVVWAQYLCYSDGKPLAECLGIEDKTVWDLVELLIMPLVLAVSAYLFSRSEHRNEQQIANDRLQEATLQAYIDKIGKLLIDDNLLGCKSDETSSVRDLAQTLTVTALRTLNADRKSLIFRFLKSAKLGDKLLTGANLEEVDLRGTDIRGIDLSKADLRVSDLSNCALVDVNLSKAYMVSTKLHGAQFMNVDFVETDMRYSDLSYSSIISGKLNFHNANLYMADLRYADFGDPDSNGVKFHGAILEEANLINSSISYDQLALASSLNKAIMPDGNVYDGRFEIKSAESN
jgi:uncharacterized protein YjbI with pentapeptide repeats